jgi:hypothetical protein
MQHILSSATSPVMPAATPADRRTRLRLRELCDEVIASFRVATDRDVLSAAERAEAKSLLARIAPTPRG